MDKEAIISLENVAVRLGSRTLLRGTNWRIRPRENWALLGPNGSGKTALGKAIAGLVPVVQGRITRRAAGEDPAGAVAYVSPEQHRQILAKEALVLEARDYSGDVHAMTSVGDLILNRAPAEDPGRQSRLAQVARLLGIQTLVPRDIQSISSGEMRKALIARALMTSPRLLILDEPFEGLDRASRGRLFAIIERLMTENVQVVLITHRREEILPGITHLMLLEEGSVRCAGRKEDVLKRAPDAAAGAFSPRSGPLGIPSPVGAVDDRAGGESHRVLIRMHAVTVAYRGVRVLDRIDWTMRNGENWMILGPNGAGKSTLLKLIYADHPQAYANAIHLFGKRVGSTESVWDIKSRIGLVSAHLQARYRRGIRALEVICSGFFDSVGLYRTCRRDQSETARRWAETLGAGAFIEQDFSRLSYGQRQLVLLARAMVKSPMLLILDEPCDGLDGPNRRNLLGLLDRIGSGSATNLLYVTHQPEDRPACITHTLRLDRGRVVEDSSDPLECASDTPREKRPSPDRCLPDGR